VLTVILSAGVILEDPPKGTAAFWLTRPLARGEVVAAKMSLLAGLVLLPVLVHSAALIGLGASGRTVALSALEQCLREGGVPFMTAALAITAEAFGQFAINAILIVIGAVVVAVITQILLAKHHGASTPHLPQTPNSLGASTALATEILSFAFAGGVLVWRYLRRHARFTILVVALGSLLLVLTPIFWKWDFLNHWRVQRGQTLPHRSQLRFFPTEAKGGNRPYAFAVLSLSSDAAGNVTVPRQLSKIEFIWSGGERTPLASFLNLQTLPLARYAPESLSKLLAPVAILNLPRRAVVPMTLPAMPPALRRRLTREPATFHAEVVASVRRYEIMGELPLKLGASKSWGLFDTEVQGWDLTAAGVTVTLREGSTASMLAGALGYAEGTQIEESRGGGRRSPSDFGSICLLVNRSRREALLPAEVTAEGITKFGAYVAQRYTLDFSSEAVNQAWLDQAVLVRVRFVELASADGNLDFEGLILSPPMP